MWILYVAHIVVEVDIHKHVRHMLYTTGTTIAVDTLTQTTATKIAVDTHTTWTRFQIDTQTNT